MENNVIEKAIEINAPVGKVWRVSFSRSNPQAKHHHFPRPRVFPA